MKLDRSKLPPGVSLDRKEGPYAELGPEGQVLHLGVYENGQRKPGTYSLDVAPDGSWARVEGPTEGSRAQGEATQDPGLMEMWVQLWSMWISQGPKSSKDASAGKEAKASMHTDMKCSFCGKRQDQVDKLVAGPQVYICNECVGLCNDMIGFDDEQSGGQ